MGRGPNWDRRTAAALIVEYNRRICMGQVVVVSVLCELFMAGDARELIGRE